MNINKSIKLSSENNVKNINFNIKNNFYFKNILDSLSHVIYKCDTKGNILYMNKKGIDLFGKKILKEKTNLKKIIISNNYNNIQSIALKNKEHGDISKYLIKDKKSKTFYVNIYANAIFKNNNLIGYNGIFENIKESNNKDEKYKYLFNHSSDAIMILDKNGFIDCNEATLKMFNIKSREQFISQHPAKFSPKTQANGKNSIKEANKQIKLAFKKGEVFFEWIHKKASGENFYANVLLNVVEIEGKKKLQATVRNISKEKEIANKLYKSESAYKTIFQNSGSAIIITNEDNTISMVNNEFIDLSGFTKEEIKNKMHWYDFFEKSELKKMHHFHNIRLKNPYAAPRNYESKFINKNKEIKNVFLTISIINGSKSNIISITDITSNKLIAEKLSASKNFLKDLVYNFPVATFVIDKEHKVTYWNKHMEKLSGIKSNEVLGTSDHWKAFYPKKQDLIIDMLVSGKSAEEIVNKHKNITIETNRNRKGLIGTSTLYKKNAKNKKYISFIVKEIKDKNNNVIGGISTTQDVTKQQNMNVYIDNRMRELQVLYQANSRLLIRTPLNSIFKSLVKDIRIACDEIRPARTRIIFDNKVYSTLKNKEKFIKKIKKDIIINHKKRGSIELGYISKISNKESFSLKQEDKILDIFIQTLEKHIKTREITERYQKLVKKSVSGIFIAQNGLIKYANPKFCRMFKYSSSILHNIELEYIFKDFKIKSNKNKNKFFSTKALKSNQLSIDVDIFIQNIDYIGEKAILGMVQDMTKIKQAQERQKNFNTELKEKIHEKTQTLKKINKKLTSLNELKDEFISVTSHELRSPLTAARGYLSFIKDQNLLTNLDKDTQKYIDRVYDNVDLLNHLVNNILDVSRIETNRFELYLMPIDITKLLKKVINSTDYYAKEKNIKINFTSKLNKELILKIDEVRIHQVLRNIIENAIKYSPEKKHINIVLEIITNKLRITVKDKGFGIPQADILNIFDKFKRAKNIQAYSISGVGLGLFISKKIINLHHGNIWAESKINKGTNFYIELPINN